ATNDTAAVAARYPRARDLWQPNRSLSAARNAGLHQTKGSCLIFLDAADRLLPVAAEAGVHELAAHQHHVFSFGRHRRIDTAGRPLPTPRQPRVTERHYETMLR